MSTGGLWWAEQYPKAPRVHIWLVQRPVPALCTHGPPAAPPAGCAALCTHVPPAAHLQPHLQPHLLAVLPFIYRHHQASLWEWVRGIYGCSFPTSSPLYLLTNSARDTFSRPVTVICSDGHPTLMYLQFTVPRCFGTSLQGPSELRG